MSPVTAPAAAVVQHPIVAAGVACGALLIGLLVQRIVSGRLHRLAARTASPWDDILVRALRGMLILWFVLGGLAVALKLVALPAEPAHLLAKALALAAFLSAIFFAVRLSTNLFRFYADRMAGIPTSLFRNVTVVVIYLVGFLIVLDYLGVSITPLLTALGVGGLAVALALQDTLSNLFAGLHILMAGKIRPGDYLKLESGDEGYIEDITWRNTVIRALSNNLIIVPNNKVASSVVTNYHLPEKEMAVLVDVGVGYDNDLRRVEALLVETAAETMKEVQGGVPAFEPFVRFHTYGGSGVVGTVILRGREFSDQYRIKHEFLARLHERFRREGISFPLPARDVRVRRDDIGGS
jgi:small-conductance mechanosensitive channel